MSQSVTRGIRVQVCSTYVPSRSAPHKSHYFFAYQVTISNETTFAVQLISRFWSITDATGKTEEVRGEGVVGEQPRLGPGESFTYTSYCPLTTQIGSMFGSYQMILDSGESFDVDIAPFTLAMPHALN